VTRVFTILAALAKAARRGAKSAGSFASNNLFVLAVALLLFKDPGGFLSIDALMALVLFFPLSADPLRKVPAARLAAWPLGRGERGLLRILSIWLNPIAWLVALLALRKAVTWQLWAAVVCLFAIAFLAPGRGIGGRPTLFRAIPRFPGPLDQLIRKDLREIFATLDFYCALLLAAVTFGFRLAGLVPRDALFPMSIAVVLALSTYAGNLFGLDGDSGMTRYRLLPLPGWQVVAAKDAAFLLVVFVLTLPLLPLAAIAAALAGLAYGHYASVTRRHPDARWRFSTSAALAGGLLQIVFMVFAATAVIDGSPWLLPACLAIYTWSAWHWGRALAAA
jgi:hypothetical protein